MNDFAVRVEQSDIDDLRDRLARTRWPEREAVDDWSQGIPLAYTRELCTYWADEYDFGFADRINAFPQSRTDIDGLGIHFLHVRSPEPDALPLVLTHGWPGSVVEFLKVLGPLADPRLTAAIRQTRSTSWRRRCRATDGATNRPPRGGVSHGSRPRGRR